MYENSSRRCIRCCSMNPRNFMEAAQSQSLMCLFPVINVLALFEIVAAVIHLGDIDFNQVAEKQCNVRSGNALKNAAKLLRVKNCTA